MKKKLPIPRLMELIFDSGYLIAGLWMGAWMVMNGEAGSVKRLWGVMALILCFGDGFHLIPRMMAACARDRRVWIAPMGYGKMMTSITMGLFYVLLWSGGTVLFGLSLTVPTILIYVIFGIRIILCLLPQNHWRTGGGSTEVGIIRNIPLLVLGGMNLWLYGVNSAAVSEVSLMWAAILLSFLFYIPVVLWWEKYPKIGMLMLPKVLTYLWMISMGVTL